MNISVVTPVFNDIRVRCAIGSVASQEHGHHIELVVVDAGSTDGTLDAIKEYGSRISVLISEPDEGIYDGMNKGIAASTGDVVGILNADDRYSDSSVIEDVAAAFEDPGVEACFGNLAYVTDSGRHVRYWKSGPHRRWKWYLGWMPPHPTFFVRRRVYDRFGRFDLRFRIAADYELMLRLMLIHRINAIYLNRIVVDMAPGGTSNRSIGNVIKANREVARAWRLNGLRGGLLVPVLKPASKLVQIAGRPPRRPQGHRRES